MRAFKINFSVFLNSAFTRSLRTNVKHIFKKYKYKENDEKYN